MEAQLYTIREMIASDFQIIRDLWVKCGFQLSKSDEPEELDRMIDHNPGLCLVVLADKKIIGGVMGGFDGRRGWVHHLIVDPDYRFKGIGSSLMEELIRRFKDKKIIKIKLEILKYNQQVIEFYKKLDWNFREDLITMSMDLD